jgi:hypothetical protein
MHGHVDRECVLSAIEEADAMIFPSLHDSGGWAVAEALTLGVPVISLDRCGPATMARLAGSDASIAVKADRHAARNIATVLGSLQGDRSPTDRFRIGRLPDWLDMVYRLSVEKFCRYSTRDETVSDDEGRIV